MRISAILREVGRNIASGTARVVTFALLLGALSAGLTMADLTAVRALTDAAARYTASGASVATLTATGRIDGLACEALATIPGVRAAGALRSTEHGITPAALPSSAIPVMEVTPGFPRVVHASHTADTGVVISQQVRDALALEAGHPIVTTTGTAAVAGTYAYPDDGRRAGYGYAALVPVPADDAFDECWVDIWPTSQQTPVLLQTTLRSASIDAELPALSQLNTSLGREFDGARAFDERLTRFVPAIALVLGAGLGFVATRIRRVQHASALHAGMARPDLVAIAGLEVICWTAPAIVFSGAVVAVFAATGPAGDMVVATTLGARIAPFAVAGAFAGTLAALVTTRERHLFHYVKDR